MSKVMIEAALVNAIATHGLHNVALMGGNENAFTIPMSHHIPFCFSQVGVPNPFGGGEIIDNITYTNATRHVVDWALEAKHFTPHQMAGLLTYKHWSVGGCIKDICKLIDCHFDTFYIVQLQTHVTQFNLIGGAIYPQLLNIFPLFGNLSQHTVVAANTNITRIIAQNRIHELEVYSRHRLDSNLICNHIPQHIVTPIANIDVTIHYLISGPFFFHDIYPRLAAVLDPARAFEDQVGGKPGQIATWDIDVSIASDPAE